MREWQSQAHVRWYCRYHGDRTDAPPGYPISWPPCTEGRETSSLLRAA